MKVAIIGSRSLDVGIAEFLPPNISLVISGGARGIDTLAEQYAANRGIPTLIITPDYKKYGRAAPLIRNRQIVDGADLVVAFWDGVSRGTEHAIRYAKQTGKRVNVHLIKKS